MNCWIEGIEGNEMNIIRKAIKNWWSCIRRIAKKDLNDGTEQPQQQVNSNKHTTMDGAAQWQMYSKIEQRNVVSSQEEAKE